MGRHAFPKTSPKLGVIPCLEHPSDHSQQHPARSPKAFGAPCRVMLYPSFFGERETQRFVFFLFLSFCCVCFFCFSGVLISAHFQGVPFRTLAFPPFGFGKAIVAARNKSRPFFSLPVHFSEQYVMFAWSMGKQHSPTQKCEGCFFILFLEARSLGNPGRANFWLALEGTPPKNNDIRGLHGYVCLSFRRVFRVGAGWLLCVRETCVAFNLCLLDSPSSKTPPP